MGISVLTFAVSLILLHFFRTERSRLIDKEIEVLASAVIASDLSGTTLAEVDEELSFALGADATTALVTIYRFDGSIFYRNQSALGYLEDRILPAQNRWNDARLDEHSFRFLNHNLSNSQLTLQIGIVLDAADIQWRTSSHRAYFFVGALFLLMILASYIMSYAVLKPLTAMADFLSSMTDSLGTEVPAVLSVKGLDTLSNGEDSEPFSRLVKEAKLLSARLNRKMFE